MSGSEICDALQVRFGFTMTPSIHSLSVNESLVAVGTGEGEVYLLNHGRKVLEHHVGLGNQSVSSILLSAGSIHSAFCYPRLFRFDHSAPRASDPIREYPSYLVAHGEDALLCGWNRLRLFDLQAGISGKRILDRKIERVAACESETLVLSGGHLYGIPVDDAPSTLN